MTRLRHLILRLTFSSSLAISANDSGGEGQSRVDTGARPAVPAPSGARAEDAAPRSFVVSTRGRKRGIVGCVAVAMGLSLAATPALAATPGTGWSVHPAIYPTNLPPGGAGMELITLENVGAAPSHDPVVVVDELPTGTVATDAGATNPLETRALLSEAKEEELFGGVRWRCTGNGTGQHSISGATTVTCVSDPAVLPHIPVGPPREPTQEGLAILVAAEGGSSGTNLVSVSGGGALLTARASNPITVTSTPASFGLDSDVLFTNADGSPDIQAGSHPYAMTAYLGFNVNAENVGGTFLAGGETRNLEVSLPPGLFGSGTSMSRCTRSQFDGQRCPVAAQIGVDAVTTNIESTSGVFHPTSFNIVPVYNMAPPAGVPVQFGFSVAGIHAFLDAAVKSGGGYTLVEHIKNVPQVTVGEDILTLWGVPADPSHNFQRVIQSAEGAPNSSPICEEAVQNCEAGVPAKPLLTLPTSCTGPLSFDFHALGTWQDESLEAESIAMTHDSEGNETGFENCAALDFSPTISAQPTTQQPDSATGLDVDLHFPRSGIEEPEGLTEANLKSTTVTLPKGLAVNPAGANGLEACSPAQIGLTTAVGTPNAEYNEAEPSCPQNSKLGTVEVLTPILGKFNAANEPERDAKGNSIPEPLQGSVYLAAQGQNPFGSLVALYVVIDDPKTGVLVKIAGVVKPDPVTGQLTATFPVNPELPFEDLKVDFFGGEHATLTTPPTCGTYTTNTTLTPWTAPAHADAHPSDSFTIAGGCAAIEAALPNSPAFSAGTLTPKAGAYSPFVLHLARADGSQRIGAIDTTLPEGLVGKLAGVRECSDSQLAAAAARSNPGEGRLEQSSPSCPLSSEVGTVTVGAGAGPKPLTVGGRAYLAGPYKGAPLSLAIITPAVAGPFDLGDVVVKTALYVNPETAQIHAVSDPLPTILQGIPLDVRSIDLDMSRPQFTLNPTSCDPMAVLGSATSTLGNVASLSNPFQVGGCSALKFKPKVALSLKGGTRRHTFPALKAVVTYPPGPGYANIARAQVTLPHSEFLEQGHIRTVCTRVQFAAGAGNGSGCPKASVYGFARATTPLLDQPLEGPVFLRSSSHKLPDLVAALGGQINVDLAGKVDTGKGGGIRNTFEVVPDAPVTKFVLEMQGGKKGLLVNSENICGKPQKALAHFVAQNGKILNLKPVIANSCKGKKKASKRVGTSHR
jgi:hypothetical protein